MKVIALSRLFAERLSATIKVPHAIISIGDPPPKGGAIGSRATFADNPNRVDTLWMRFYDLDMSFIDQYSILHTLKDSTFFNMETAEDARIFQEEYGHGLFTEEHAAQILDFLDAVKDEVNAIVCNCEAGVSRSSAVAAAILRITTGSDEKIFNDPRYIPNRFIYRTILNVWEERRADDA